MFLGFFPEISHIVPLKEQNFYVTLDEKVGCIFKLNPLDLEIVDTTYEFQRLTRLLRALPPSVLMRVYSKNEMVWKDEAAHFRKEMISQFGALHESLYLGFELRAPISTSLALLSGVSASIRKKDLATKRAERLSEIITPLGLKGFGASHLDAKETECFFNIPKSEIIKASHSVDTGFEHIGTIRLLTPGTNAIGIETLARLRESLPHPYDISVSLQPISKSRTQYFLKKRISQESHSQNSTSSRKLDAVQEALDTNTIDGTSFLKMEWIFVVRRKSEEALKQAAYQAMETLSPLGDVIFETVGSALSYRSTCFGSEQHLGFLEKDIVAPYFLPILSRGEPKLELAFIQKRALALHRPNRSIAYFDFFNPKYTGFGTLINGHMGAGKSVLANLISSSLLKDPRVRLVKIDVGGSYSKECELEKGEEYRISMDEPSGLNPFATLKLLPPASNDAAEIVSTYLSSLILETGESSLSREMMAALEKAVKAYHARNDPDPSLDRFLKSSEILPRRMLLERWTKGGIFENILKPHPHRSFSLDTKYRYFNLQSLQNAAQSDFAQGVMSAVIAQIALEVVRAGDARNAQGNRIVFFADEVPTFIQKNGRFFLLFAKNARKFGHGSLYIAQSTEDFVLDRGNGEVDLGILENSSTRFFYQVDGNEETFKNRFQLDQKALSKLKNLQRMDSLREVLLQDELGSRTLQIQVTEAEYWRITSSRADNERLYEFLKKNPKITLQEAIRCFGHGLQLSS